MTGAPQVQYVKTSDGVNIAFCAVGNGPPVVWVQSPAQSHIQLEWEQPVLRAGYEGFVADGATLIRYDTRGTGLSDRNLSNISLPGLVRDLEAVVDKLQLDRFILFAVELGAPAAMAYTAEHPERVSRMIILNPAVGDYATARLQVLWDTDDWELFSETVASFAFGFGFEGSHQYAAFIRACIDKDAVAVFNSIAASAVDVGRRVGTPTLVIRHTGATWLKMESTRALVAELPDARMVSIEGTYSDHPGQTARAIAEFLAPELLGSSSATREPEQSSERRPEPSGLRTVLFTDLVGHTEMMSRLGDERGRDVLREHERITREVLKANGGTEVKTMGDGFMASFGSVTKAVECAVALQRAFADRDGEPLSVRVGLNAGEPIEEDGDLFGATVILASRIAAKADGGEILVADTVRGLCSGKGFLFADRGEFVAKGFEEPVRVYEVSWRS
jgi:class 3 adenylate cyclase